MNVVEEGRRAPGFLGLFTAVIGGARESSSHGSVSELSGITAMLEIMMGRRFVRHC
jgi:hypothetical protein